MKNSYNGPRLVSDRSTSDDATVARLLRLAGHRPDVPTRDAEIVKRAARGEWMRTVKAERRRTFFYRGTAGLLAAAALVLLVLNVDIGRTSSLEPIATVEMATGLVRASAEQGSPADLVSGETLLPGTVVETGPLGGGVASAPARVAFRLADGTSLRLDAGTRVRLLSGNSLSLDHGALYADSGPNAPASAHSLEIHTPFGIARDIGTQFEVRLDDSSNGLEVRVREGEVILDREDHASHTVGAGFELAVLPDGSVAQTPISPFGPEWDWTLGALPPFDAAGKPLHDLLTWAARESGWRLRWADPALAAEFSSITVHGSIDDMTPEEAAGVFLSASGLAYRLEDGVFLVERVN